VYVCIRNIFCAYVFSAYSSTACFGNLEGTDGISRDEMRELYSRFAETFPVHTHAYKSTRSNTHNHFFIITPFHLLSLPPSLLSVVVPLLFLSLLDPDKFVVCIQEASADVKRSALAYLEGLVVNKVESLRIPSISPKYCTSCHTNLLCQH
jgi:hypothetical protein